MEGGGGSVFNKSEKQFKNYYTINRIEITDSLSIFN